jgi:hypothetical protein
MYPQTLFILRSKWSTLLLLSVLLFVALLVRPTHAALPSLLVNQGLSLSTGATKTINTNMLRVSKGSTTANQLFYYLETAPTNGALLLNGTPLSIGAYFTQDDINSGRVAYRNTSGATASDSFGFSVRSTERISVASNGTEANAVSNCPSLSADGRYVAFFSPATNLVSGDTNGMNDIFLRDRQNDTTTRASIASDGTQANGDSICPSISSNGRYVLFDSSATNLVSGDTLGKRDIFVRDLQSSTTTRVSIASNGAEANGDSYTASISADGRYVVFSSSATNLVSGDVNGKSDVFLRDRQNNTTTRISVATNGSEANGDSWGMISDDGRYVAFMSYAFNLVANDSNGKSDIFVRDLQNNTTTLASLTFNGTQENDDAQSVSISGDGRYVSFQSFATNLVSGDTNGINDIFVRDRQNNTTTRVSVYRRIRRHWFQSPPTVPKGTIIPTVEQMMTHALPFQPTVGSWHSTRSRRTSCPAIPMVSAIYSSMTPASQESSPSRSRAVHRAFPLKTSWKTHRLVRLPSMSVG